MSICSSSCSTKSSMERSNTAENIEWLDSVEWCISCGAELGGFIEDNSNAYAYAFQTMPMPS